MKLLALIFIVLIIVLFIYELKHTGRIDEKPYEYEERTDLTGNKYFFPKKELYSEEDEKIIEEEENMQK